jgi:hypothetical protein
LQFSAPIKSENLKLIFYFHVLVLVYIFVTFYHFIYVFGGRLEEGRLLKSREFNINHQVTHVRKTHFLHHSALEAPTSWHSQSWCRQEYFLAQLRELAKTTQSRHHQTCPNT